MILRIASVVIVMAFCLTKSVYAGRADYRVIVETDAGGDPDDEQSLVRLLLYSNEFDIAAVIANRPIARDGENKNPERTGLGIVRRIIKKYGECYETLASHDSFFPPADELALKSHPGYNDTDEGVRAILRIVDEDDKRPIWYMDWGTDHGGATNNLQRALDRVLAERGKAGYVKFKTNINVIFPSRLITNHTAMAPAWPVWVNTWEPPMEGKRWYHRFSAITASAGGFDVREHILKSPLGSVYPTNTTHWQKEGDTMSFLYLVQVGMNHPTQPTWGSWAGRYGRNENFPDLPYYWANQRDAWNGTTNRDNTLGRWAAHLQNDFRARLAWCTTLAPAGNHPPRVYLNGKERPFYLHCKAGELVSLDSAMTFSDLGEKLRYEWEAYPEAGTYQGAVTFTHTNLSSTQVKVPADAAGKNIHVILTVTDNGTPPLSRYGRAILEVHGN